MTYLNVNSNPLVWLNIGYNKKLNSHISDSTISLDVNSDSFDITKVFTGINPEKITVISDAKIDGSIISSYRFDTPVVYTYDCGTDTNGPVTLTVTLNLS